MRVIMVHADLILSKLGGPPGVLYLAITWAQIRTYGLKHWAKWGFGTGVLRDGFEQIEREAGREIEKATKEIESDIEDEINKL